MSSRSTRSLAVLLKSVPLLVKLSDAERATLGSALVERKYNAGDSIIKQGEEGKGFYIISKGEVVVTRNTDTKANKELGKLKAGDFFGETALINNKKRGATVTALVRVTCWYLTRDNFNSLFGSEKLNVRFAKRKAVSAEKRTNYTPTMPAGATKAKSPGTRSLILAAVKDNVLFMNLDKDHKNKIIDEMYRMEVKNGTSVIVQGEMGDNLYVVESGEFHVYVNKRKVAVRGKGTCFGELALMYNSPRAATCTASTSSVVWVVDRFTFRRVVTDLSSRKLGTYVQFLSNVDLLTPLAQYEREKIAEALEEESYKAGSVIMRQGEKGDFMYIVHSGEVVITRSDNGGAEKEVNRAKKGGYFGERALVKNESRAATITAVTDVNLLKLDRNAFALLLGPLEDIMKKNIERYERKEPAQKEEAPSNSDKVEFNNLHVMGTLGKGSFGHVQLVQDKTTGKTYALKAVSKAQIVQTGQQGHIMSEKRVMAVMKHPFLVRLFATYNSRDRLYFLLEPSLGGELFSVLREKTLFDEDTARFYAGSVVLAFEYMHSKNIIYRDLKPENLLIDERGYLKVTDFGFAKDISGGRTWTLCGTPDYLAPEIVAGKGHGKGVDWWTLGVFIYEMLASYPPFYDEDPMKTYAKIMHGSITFPSHFSKEAISVVKKLLHHKPTKRLGVVKGGAKLIKKHPWFKGFDWDSLINKRLKPSIVPQIKNNMDLSNFDDYPDEDEDVEPYTDDGTGWDADF